MFGSDCVLCHKELIGYSNNPWPLGNSMNGGCCDKCNNEKVLPARIALMKEKNDY